MALKNDGGKYKELYPKMGAAEISWGAFYGTYSQPHTVSYSCVWRIIEERLYLEKVKGEILGDMTRHYSTDEIEQIMGAYMDEAFGEKGLFAHQLSGVLYAKPANTVGEPRMVTYGTKEYWEPYNKWYASPIFRLTFKEGHLVEMLPLEAANPDTTPDESEIFYEIETQPEFPGGMPELMKYIQKNTRYPKECKEQGVQGRVIVQFVVNTDSTITDVNVVKPVNPYLDQEAVRVVKAMPKWNPGKQRGEPVRVRFTLPVTFRLPADTVKVNAVSADKQ
jgi:TonB family protein